ncbi:MAG: alpha-amylase family protein [Ferruginibacter sp.]
MNSDEFTEAGGSRRSFLKKSALAAVVLAGTDLSSLLAKNLGDKDEQGTDIPWYRRVTRWGQINITEKDPSQYDIPWWRKYWKQTGTEGIVVNAGGIVAYYPTLIPLQRKATYLEGRDLFGELSRAAREDGLAVFARMDSNRAHEEFYKAHPGWFALNKTGKPYKAGDLYISCINSPYYEEHIPAILKEISGMYHPEGFTDNSWSGLDRSSICYCENCKKSFFDKTQNDIPLAKNWDDPVYKKWIRWNYNRRLEIWDLNNRVTKAAGGPLCIWVGMNSGSVSSQSNSFRDYKEICRRADIIMLDNQARSDLGGFQLNGGIGKIVHGLLGWDKLIPESMAMYQAGNPTFRLTSKPEHEARMWMVEGAAGGIQPWWHMVGAYHEDRRMYRTAGPFLQWHQNNKAFLIDRRPVASVGVVWSQENTDFYGRDNAHELVDLPWRGITEALIRDHIPYLPVHADHIDRDAGQFSLLILPNLAIMTDDQVASVQRFVEQGGSLIATDETSLFNEEGDKRNDYALGDLFGAHRVNSDLTGNVPPGPGNGDSHHTYLRLTPELRSQVMGPHNSEEPPVTGNRHVVLKGFDETDILPYGGLLTVLRTEAHVEIPLTFIPEFPVYPPETAWMRIPKTDIPGLILNTRANKSRIAFLPADIDRQFGNYNLPDHGNLLANIIRWAVKDNIPLKAKGAGLVDYHLYSQPGRLVLHIVNLTSAGTWRQPVHELISIGPLQVQVKLPGDAKGNSLRTLVTDQKILATVVDGWCHFEIKSVLDHEVVVIA